MTRRIQSAVALSVAALFIAATCLPGPAMAQPSITNLSVLSGGTYSYAEAISSDGLVVTGSSGSSAGQRAFRWTASGGLQNLGVLSGFTVRSWGAALSADGAVVAGVSQGAGNVARAFRWTSATGMQNLGVLGTGSISGARAISSDGSTIVGTSYVSGFNGATAMRWTAATGMQNLGGVGSVAAAITSDGAVSLGTDLTDGYFHAARWTPTMQYLSILTGADSAEVYAVSADGSIAAGHSGDQLNATYDHAVRWTGLPGSGTIQDLGVLGQGVYSHADAMSADGSVVGGASTLPTGDHAFLWTPTLGMVDLNTYLPSLGLALTGWTLADVRGISADGSAIVGYGSFNGADRGFLVSGIPVPPPVPCYANCDRSTVAPMLNVNDFQCFLNKFAAGDSYANCDGSSLVPILNVNDFQCFLNKFATGCP